MTSGLFLSKPIFSLKTEQYCSSERCGSSPYRKELAPRGYAGGMESTRSMSLYSEVRGADVDSMPRAAILIVDTAHRQPRRC
jgi:hypothetical protein